MSVPSYFTQEQREALLNAGKISGLKLNILENESTANVMNYGIFRKKDLDEKKARLVGFLDVGYSKTSLFFAQIKKNRASILFEVNEPNLGIRDMDLITL